MLPHLRNRDYCQLAWVVPDLESAIDRWVRTTGAGPFFLFDALHFDDANYRGTPMDIAPCRAAIGMNCRALTPIEPSQAPYSASTARKRVWE